MRNICQTPIMWEKNLKQKFGNNKNKILTILFVFGVVFFFFIVIQAATKLTRPENSKQKTTQASLLQNWKDKKVGESKKNLNLNLNVASHLPAILSVCRLTYSAIYTEQRCCFTWMSRIILSWTSSCANFLGRGLNMRQERICCFFFIAASFCRGLTDNKFV